jgi:hypothetical protein
VDQFVSIGKGVIKLLIMDREFIDGAMISRFKKTHGIDCLVPLKSNMHALLDALGISRMEKVSWMKYEEVKDERGRVIEVEEVAGVGEVKSWDRCEVPLYVVLVRTRKADGQSESGLWLRLKESNPRFAESSIRVGCRSRKIDQIKNCWWSVLYDPEFQCRHGPRLFRPAGLYVDSTLFEGDPS